MSGPKMVRVVTREERIAESKGHLDRLEHVFSKLEKMLQEAGLANESELAEQRQQIGEIADLLEKDQFDVVNARTQTYMDYLKKEISITKSELKERKLTQRTRKRHLMNTARSLAARIDAAGVDVPVSEKNRLQLLVDGEIGEIADAESQLQTLLSWWADESTRDQLTDEQKALSAKLVVEQGDASYEDWMTEQVANKTNPLMDIDKHLSELEIELGEEFIKPFTERLTEVQNRQDSDNWQSLVDTLLLDLSSAVNIQKQCSEWLDELESLMLLIRSIDVELAAKLEAQLVHLRRKHDPALLEKAFKEYEGQYQQLQKAANNESRRQLILAGLEKLGYEINEEMQLALANNGKLVVQNSENENYGVELIGLKDKNQLQVRAVVLSDGEERRSKEEDLHAEESWCDQFDELKKMLTDQGSKIEVVKALKVGDVEMKVVSRNAGTSRKTTSTRRKSTRKMD